MNHPERIQPQGEHRAIEILEGVRQAFAEKGFDGASMLDLARAFGMSVGNFYRYFPSKAAIVSALITRDLAEVEDQFSAIIESDDPMATLRMALRMRIEQDQCEGDGQLWAEITAAAMRKPEIEEITRHMESEIIGYLTTVFARARHISELEARNRYQPHASLLVMMIKGSAMHPGQDPESRTHLTELVIRTINRVLDEIVSDDLKG
jgi:AcrR family transcriptional regulator